MKFEKTITIKYKVYNTKHSSYWQNLGYRTKDWKNKKVKLKELSSSRVITKSTYNEHIFLVSKKFNGKYTASYNGYNEHKILAPNDML